MSTGVFLAVLLAALLHAGWNALVKSGADKVAAMAALAAGQGLAGLALAPFVGVPPVAVWGWLTASIGLHVGYNVFLGLAYRVGDLTQVYPLARGAAPLIVLAVSTAFLGEAPGPMEKLAVLLICGGIISIGLARVDGFDAGALTLALVTGGFIAGYTLVDGIGARLSGAPLGYWTWCAMVQGALFVAGAAALRRTSPRALLAPQWKTLVFGGGASFIAYLLVVWAVTKAPMAQVAALRETSIVFALLIGALVLKERISLRKVLGAMGTLTGAALLKSS